MPRGFRCILVAFVGWLSLASAQNQTTQRDQPKAETNQGNPASAIPPPPAKAVEPVEAPKLYRPCDEGENARYSDLCAQWKAADAARDAANWTRWGVLLGILGTVGLFWTLHYTRKAVRAAEAATKDAVRALEIAERNANAAAALAEISRDSMQTDLRAWLGISCEVTRGRVADRGFVLSVTVQLQNYGKSPVAIAEVSLITFTRTNYATEGKIHRRAFTHQPFEPIMPGESSKESFALTFENDMLAEIIGIAEEQNSGTILGFRAICQYATMFDDQRTRPRKSKVTYTVSPRISEDWDGPIDQIHWVEHDHAGTALNVWPGFSGLVRLS